MPKNKQSYINNSLGRIQATVFGMCMGANYKGLKGGMLHYDDGERGRLEIEKEIKRLVKYLMANNIKK